MDLQKQMFIVDRSTVVESVVDLVVKYAVGY